MGFHPDDHKIIDISREHPIVRVKRLLEELYPIPQERAGIAFTAFVHACKEQGMNKNEIMGAAASALSRLELMGAKI